MEHIKNFKLAPPRESQLKDFPRHVQNSISFLISDDGKDWYQSQKDFRDDTVKIMYDSQNRIVSVVDKPIPTRGYTYAVSMLYPVNCSVVEIEVADWPIEAKANGEWLFENNKVIPNPSKFIPNPNKSDNKNIKFIETQDGIVPENYPKPSSKETYKMLMQDATQALTILQCAVEDRNPEEVSYELCMIRRLKKYILELVSVDLTSNPVVWPIKPEGLK